MEALIGKRPWDEEEKLSLTDEDENDEDKQDNPPEVKEPESID